MIIVECSVAAWPWEV